MFLEQGMIANESQIELNPAPRAQTRKERLWALLQNTPNYWDKASLLFAQPDQIVRGILTLADSSLQDGRNTIQAAEIKHIATEVLAYKLSITQEVNEEMRRIQAEHQSWGPYLIVAGHIVLLLVLFFILVQIKPFNSNFKVQNFDRFVQQFTFFCGAMVFFLGSCNFGHLVTIIYRRYAYNKELNEILLKKKVVIEENESFRKYLRLELACKKYNLEQKQEFFATLRSLQLNYFNALVNFDGAPRSTTLRAAIQQARNSKRDEKQNLMNQYEVLNRQVKKYIVYLTFTVGAYALSVGLTYLFLNIVSAGYTEGDSQTVPSWTTSIANAILANKDSISYILFAANTISFAFCFFSSYLIYCYGKEFEKVRGQVQLLVSYHKNFLNNFEKTDKDMHPYKKIHQISELSEKEKIIFFLREMDEGKNPNTSTMLAYLKIRPKIYREIKGYRLFETYLSHFNHTIVPKFAQIYRFQMAQLGIGTEYSTMIYCSYYMDMLDYKMQRGQVGLYVDALTENGIFTVNFMKEWNANPIDRMDNRFMYDAKRLFRFKDYLAK